MRLTEDWYVERAGDVVRPATREWDMKFKLVVPAILILLLASFPVHAKNSRPFFLRTAVTLNGAEVPAGLYDLSWESHNSTVSVTLWKDGRFIATSEGIWVKHGVKYAEDAVLLRVNSDGSRSLVEIRMAGIKKTIVLNSIDPILRLSAK
jgi:hypothetical protein